MFDGLYGEALKVREIASSHTGHPSAKKKKLNRKGNVPNPAARKSKIHKGAFLQWGAKPEAPKAAATDRPASRKSNFEERRSFGGLASVTPTATCSPFLL